MSNDHKFERRHYEQIALAIQSSKRLGIGVVDAIVNMLACDNCRFDKDRFIAACAVGANVSARPKKEPKPKEKKLPDPAKVAAKEYNAIARIGERM